MHKKINKQKNTGRQILSEAKGYTIIETMIAVSLFLVVIMAGMGALLNANLLHQKSQSMRSIMDNLSFIIEDVSRNLRTGYKFHCINDGNFTVGTIVIPKSCASGGAIAFENDFGNNLLDTDQWIYKIESSGVGQPFNIFKSVDSGTTWVQLNPNEVVIDSISGFSVLGAEPPNADGTGNHQQPFVNIKLIGRITFKNVVTPFFLQTSMSQRLIDI